MLGIRAVTNRTGLSERYFFEWYGIPLKGYRGYVLGVSRSGGNEWIASLDQEYPSRQFSFSGPTRRDVVHQMLKRIEKELS